MRKPRAVQIAGDVDPFSYGGIFVHTKWHKGGDADMQLIRIEPIADAIGEREALEYTEPFWVSSAYVDYPTLVAYIRDDAVYKKLCDMLDTTLVRPACGRRYIKNMVQYFLFDDDKVSELFEPDDDIQDILSSFSFRGFRGDPLGRDLRAARKEHTLARLRARYNRNN